MSIINKIQYKENISTELKKVGFIVTPIGKLIKKS